MILADTSVWIDLLRRADAPLRDALNAKQVVIHRVVIGELAMGTMRDRARILESVSQLPLTIEASVPDTMQLVERRQLYGRGIGFLDAQLLASALLGDHLLWTLDERLASIVAEFGIAYDA